MKITNGTLTKDATPEQAKALAAAGWKPVAAPAPAKRPAPRNLMATPEHEGYDGSWEAAVFPRATDAKPGSFAAKLGGDVLSLPFRALASVPAALGAGDETVAESLNRTGGRADEPGWMQFLDDVIRSPVNAVLPGATRMGGMLFKGAGSPAGLVVSNSLRTLPASVAIAGGNQAELASEGKPLSMKKAAVDAALAQTLGVGLGVGLGKLSQKLSDRTGKARAVASEEIRTKMAPPDEAASMGILPGEEGAAKIADDLPELTIPQIKRAERDLPTAEKVEAEARDAFMRMMKFLPGKANRSIWEAGFRLADDPKILEELIRDAKTIPDVVANQQAGMTHRIAARKPITEAMDATGLKISVDDLVRAAEESVLNLRKGEAAPTEANRAVSGVERLLYTPPAGQRAVYRDPGTGDFASSPTFSGDLPINAETELLPSVAQNLKSALYSRAKFQTPDAGVRAAATRGASLKAKQLLEELDPTGKLKKTNADMADWIAASEGFLRSESRDANRDARSEIMQFLFPKNSPEEISRMLLKAKLARAAGSTAEAGGTIFPDLSIRASATDNTRTAR